MSRQLKHVGVKGMKWGVRKAVRSAGDWAKAAGTMTKNGITNPFLADRANKESIASSKTATQFRRAMLIQTTKEINDVNSRFNALKDSKKRTDPVYDKSGNDISANPYKRLFKQKGQSDKDFDKEYDAELRQTANDIKLESKAKALATANRNAKVSEFLDGYSTALLQTSAAMALGFGTVVAANLFTDKIREANK